MPVERLTFVLVTAMLLAARAGAGNPASVTATSNGGADTPEEPAAVIATGDFNGDGIADIVKSVQPDGGGAGPQVLEMLLGKADGRFERGDSRNVIGRDPRAMVVGDFNGDGKLDVIVGDADGTLLEFTGDGRGHLAPAGKAATLGSAVSIAVGRFTRSGNLDLVVSDAESNAAVIFLGNGDGSFRQAWSFQLPQKGVEFQVATADFNRDGIADIVISTSEDDGNYEVMLGNGNGTFTYAPQLSHLRDPNSYCPT